ncbi:MAG: glycosyltransferase [Bacteroidaceae bacterium]
MRYSFIIPVYNRPDETDELLESLSQQTLCDFEVIVVEDGSQITCQQVVQAHAAQMPIKYFSKPNSGPGQTRNYGAERSQGEYLIFLDSDCVLPPGYLEAVDKELQEDPCDAFGGPDCSHPSFTPIQKAISYSMTSFFTTGGIRGGRKKLDRFYPRSFNMGIQANLYRRLGGFSQMRFGEDIDLSIRIFQSGATCRLFPEAWVWHKRRTDLRKFFRQVHNSGIARINLYKKYPSSLKPVHLLPAVFTLGMICLLLLFLTGIGMGIFFHASALGCWWNCTAGISLLFPLLYSFTIMLDSTWQNRSLCVGSLSVVASFVQLIGYGTGFLRAWWLRCVCGNKEEMQAFRDTFYK